MKSIYSKPLCTVHTLDAEDTILAGSIGVDQTTKISTDNNSNYDIASKGYTPFSTTDEEE